MASPVVESSSTGTSDGGQTNHSFTLPATISAGALLLIFGREAAAGTISISGWTVVQDSSDASDDVTFYAYKTAVGNEDGTSITISTSGAASKLACVCLSITGAADPAVQAPQASTIAIGTDANPNSTTVTPTGGAKDYLWLACAAWAGSPTRTTIPSGFTSEADASLAGGSAATQVKASVASLASNASSQDPGQWVISAASPGWSAWTLAVHPAGAAGDHPLDALAGSYALTGVAAKPVSDRIFSSLPGSFALTGVADQLLAGRAVLASPGSYALSGSAIQNLRTLIMGLAPGSYGLTGDAAAIVAARLLGATPGAYALTGDAADLVFVPVVGAFELNGDPGSYSLTGSAVGALRTLVMGLSPGAYGVSEGVYGAGSYGVGTFGLGVGAADLLAGRLLAASPGSYAQSGSIAGVLAGRVLGALPGSHALSGDDTDLVRLSGVIEYVLDVDPGSFALSGSAVGALRALVMGLSPGSYGLSGSSSTLAVFHAYILTAAAGSYALSGDAAGVKRGYNLSASPGSVSTSGAVTQFRRTYIVGLSPGVYGVLAIGAGLAHRLAFSPISPGSLSLVPDPPGTTTIDPADRGSLGLSPRVSEGVYGVGFYGAGIYGLIGRQPILDLAPNERGSLVLTPESITDDQ